MAEEKKSEAKKLRERLEYKKKCVWDALDEAARRECTDFSEKYKDFLNEAKTEREAVDRILDAAGKVGFQEFDPTKPGTSAWFERRNKCVALYRPGKKKNLEGIRIVISHIDSPRLDLKQCPLYEDNGFVLLKTHYYGGIKKYQWANIQLALHGVIILADGGKLNLVIGEKPDEPVFTIPDIAPHLWKKVQADKKAHEIISGEQLNILSASIPYPDKDAKDRVKLALLQRLNAEYGIIEEDFLSAEIEAVPAGLARDLGFDRSLVGSYGQDDRICAYTSLAAVCETPEPERASLVVFMDKEEIGSEGATGAQSQFIENVMSLIVQRETGSCDSIKIDNAFIGSQCLSSDVTAGINPNFPEVHEKRNAPWLGYGPCMSKVLGSGGKYSSNDADAEFVGKMRRLFKEKDIIWQAGELGKVDEGGGGTVAGCVARYGGEVVDIGPPLLGMHSPFEISGKGDIYMTYKAYKAFLEGR